MTTEVTANPQTVDLNALIAVLGASIEAAYGAESAGDVKSLIAALATLTTAIAAKL